MLLAGPAPGPFLPVARPGNRLNEKLNEKKLQHVGEVKSLMMTENRERWGRGCGGASRLRESEMRRRRTPVTYGRLWEKRKNIPLL